MNNDLIARRLKPPTPAAASLPSNPGPLPATPPPFTAQSAPYASQSAPFERSDVPWDRPPEPELTVEPAAPLEPTLTVEPEATAEPEPIVEPVADAPVFPLEALVAEPEPTLTSEPEATTEPMLIVEPEATADVSHDTPPATEQVSTPSPERQALADMLAGTAIDSEPSAELTADALAAFPPDDDFVSASPPWESPPDETWPLDEWSLAAMPVAEATAEHTTEPTAESVAEPTTEPTAESVAEPTTEPTAESVAEVAADPVVEVSATADELTDPAPSLDLRLPDTGGWTPHAPEAALPVADTPVEYATVEFDGDPAADHDDALAPLTDDLLVAVEPVEQPLAWPERDLAATMIEYQAGDEAADFETSAQADETEPSTPDVVGPEPLLAWEAAAAGPSVFGELFNVVDSLPAEQPLHSDDFVVLPEETVDVPETEAVDLAPPESSDPTPPSPVEWPPVPTGFFPPPPDALPALNVELPAEGVIDWPDDPRVQTFWPADAPAADAGPTVDDAWVPAPPALAADDPLVDPQLRFVSPPRATVAGANTAGERPTLVFADTLPPAAEPDTREGVLSRIGNQATVFAERLPDGWSLPSASSLTMTGEEAVARDLKEIQSPALTVLFAIVAIAAVLLFVYLVTPLLR